MSTNSRKIAELLHLARSPGWTTDDTLKLSAAVRAATEDEQRGGLLEFVVGMLTTARQVVTLQRDAAIVGEIMDERDAQGPVH